mmetsp:Transcript_14157/g.23132  ORF Transcript_14157/g.23132 Transcript_14157/m.23132 type:complete len:120 (+) Transcript_14157:100-459(+)
MRVPTMLLPIQSNRFFSQVRLAQTLHSGLPHPLAMLNAVTCFPSLFPQKIGCIIERTIFKLDCFQFIDTDQICFPLRVAKAPPMAPYTAAPINPGGNLDPYNVYGLTNGTPITPRETPM